MTVRKFFKAFELDLLINDTSKDWSSDPTSYNTPKTTDDPNASVGEIKTYRWVRQSIQRDLNAFPSLIDVTTTPPKIEQGGSIGLRATGTASIGDVVSNDMFELPESMSDRRITGSANRKLMARNYIINRPCRVLTGTDPYDFSTAFVENYFVNNISISKSGELRVEFVDPLYFTNGEKAKAPTQTNATLTSDIDEFVTVFTISDPDGEFVVGDTGFIRQSSEIYSYEVTDVNELTVVREQAGSTASAHSAGDTVQKMLVYQNINVVDIWIDIFENYTTIDNSFIPYSKWNELKSGDLSSFNLTNFIGEPTAVKEILKQTIEITGVSMFFDVELQEITIIAVPRFTEASARFTDELKIEQGSCKVTPSFKNKITRQQINWGKTDYTQGDEERYYSNGFVIIDGAEEGEFRSAKEFSGKKITTNWLEDKSPEHAQIATRVPQLNVARFSETPKLIEFNTDREYIGGHGDSRVWLGSVIEVETEQNLGADLSRVPLLAQITGITPKDMNRFFIQALSYKGNVLPKIDLYINSTTQDYVLSDVLNPTEDREYIVMINNGVDIGSTSTSFDSFDTGVFPSGASLRLVILGRILGCGADGADTGSQIPVAKPAIGGTALNINVNTIIDNLSGFIGGGGGGGGAAFADLYTKGGSGGGGQGFDGGNGGLSVYAVGDSGSITSPGSGGQLPDGENGGRGGFFGEKGVDTAHGEGGDPGLAIKTNGYSVIITAGNNSAQIKGLIV